MGDTLIIKDEGIETVEKEIERRECHWKIEHMSFYCTHEQGNTSR